MTYLFSGAFCSHTPSREAAARAAFPDALVTRFDRGAPTEIWYPGAGLIGITRPTRYTALSDLSSADMEDHLEFFEAIQARVARLSGQGTFVALQVDCWGGLCGLDIRVYQDTRCVSSVKAFPDDYHRTLTLALGLIGCELNARAYFPPLMRGAFAPGPGC